MYVIYDGFNFFLKSINYYFLNKKQEPRNEYNNVYSWCRNICYFPNK